MIYRKEYMKELNFFKDNKIIKVVTGMRRSGKSTLLNMFSDELLADGVKKEQIQFINFELMKYDSIRNYKDLYNLVVSNILTNRKNYLFFDEIQQVQGWEKAINSISIEYDADIYITGSNAYLLSSELSTLISGRYVEIKILPLSFKEYFEYYNDKNMSREEIEEKIKNIQYNSEKIICLTTGKVFNSVKQAEQFYGMKKSNIRKCCKGERETCGKLPDGTKLKWMFLKDYKGKGGE